MADSADKSGSLDPPHKLTNGCKTPDPCNGLNGDGDVRSPSEESQEIHFKPIIQLPEVEVVTLEEHETELFKMRAKLYRYDNKESPAEWKERGTGTIKILRDEDKNSIRILMRRDKTHKICANHQIMPEYELKPNCGSDKAFVWSVFADFADEIPKPELLAIRFANAEAASEFKSVFEESKIYMKDRKNTSIDNTYDSDSDSSEVSQPSAHDAGTTQITDKLKDLDVSDKISNSECKDSGSNVNDTNIQSEGGVTKN